jgi:hypothetical protein
MDTSSPARKAHAKEYMKKLAAFQTLAKCSGGNRLNKLESRWQSGRKAVGKRQSFL